MIVMAALVGYTGGNLLNASPASAESNTKSTNNQQPPNQDGDMPPGPDGQHPPDPTKGGHKGKNGTKEELLTGETADKVKAAALAAQPGATVMRVETDAEGAKYEAHVKKSDGTMLTLKFDENFKVTATEEGHGPGPGHRHGHRPDQKPSENQHQN